MMSDVDVDVDGRHCTSNNIRIRITGMDCGEGDYHHDHGQASTSPVLPLPEEASMDMAASMVASSIIQRLGVLKRRDCDEDTIITTTIVNKTTNMYNHHDENEGRHCGHQLNGNGNGKQACCNRYCGTAGLASSSANTQRRTIARGAGRSSPGAFRQSLTMTTTMVLILVAFCLPILASASAACGGRDNYNCGTSTVTLFNNLPWLKEEQRDNVNGSPTRTSHTHRQLQVQRQLQQTATSSSSSLIHVLDMGLDIPPADSQSNNANVNLVKSNGVTLTVKNESKDQPIQFLGLEVYTAMGGTGTTTGDLSAQNNNNNLHLYVRKGDDRDVTTPLELESSADWDMLKEMSLEDEYDNSSSNYKFVSVPLSSAYTIPANSAVTLFIFVAQSQTSALSASASIMTLSRASRIVNESSAGSDGSTQVSIKSGTAIRNNIPSSSQNENNNNPNPWVSIPYSAFLGSILCGFPTTEGTSLPLAPSPYYTTDTMTVWKLGDVPARTYGIAFDVYSKTGCNITSLDIHTPLTAYMVVEVYSKQDGSSYYADTDTTSSSQSWTLTSKVGIQGLGQLTTTPLPPEQFKTIEMPPNSKVAFYITTTQVELASIHTNSDIMTGQNIVVRGANVTYSSSSPAEKSNPMQDTTIDIMAGQTVTEYPVFSSNANNLLSLPKSALGGNAIFSGKIHYEHGVPVVIPTPPPPPDLNPELTSQLKLSLTGVSRRTLRRLAHQGDGSNSIMNNKAIRDYFEEVGRVFVNGMVNQKKYQPRITVRRFVVSPDLSEDSVSAVLLGTRSMLRGRRDLQNENNDTEATLEVYTTILGEYSPPPVVDFSSLTENSFNNEGNGDAFVGNLKSDAIDAPPEVKDVFQQIQGVRAVQVTFPKPANLYEDPPDDPPDEPVALPLLTIVYIAAGGAVFLLVMAVTICMLCRRKREKQDEKKHKHQHLEEQKQEQDQNQNKLASYRSNVYNGGGGGSGSAYDVLGQQQHDGGQERYCGHNDEQSTLMTATEGANSSVSYYHSQGSGLSPSMRSMSGRGSLGAMSAGNASGSRMGFEGGGVGGGGEALSEPLHSYGGSRRLLGQGGPASMNGGGGLSFRSGISQRSHNSHTNPDVPNIYNHNGNNNQDGGAAGAYDYKPLPVPEAQAHQVADVPPPTRYSYREDSAEDPISNMNISGANISCGSGIEDEDGCFDDDHQSMDMETVIQQQHALNVNVNDPQSAQGPNVDRNAGIGSSDADADFDRRASLGNTKCRDVVNQTEDEGEGPEPEPGLEPQKFWSVSGRHMVSASGDQVWDAVTGEEQFDFGLSNEGGGGDLDPNIPPQLP
jgi:hypothetical protein